jgi:hypothetical protein
MVQNLKGIGIFNMHRLEDCSSGFLRKERDGET